MAFRLEWDEERYVRAYTRDTVDFMGLSWQAQGLYFLLRRKADRAGFVDLGKHGKAGIASLVGGRAAWTEVEPCLDELLTDGCVRLEPPEAPTVLVIEDFMTSEQARFSDRARKEAQRERLADKLKRGLIESFPTSPHAEDELTRANNLARRTRDNGSRNVTDGHALRSQAPTDEGQTVTKRDEKSPDPPTAVTPFLSVPFLAVPVGAVPDRARARDDADDESLAGQVLRLLAGKAGMPQTEEYAQALAAQAFTSGVRPADALRAIGEVAAEAGMAYARGEPLSGEALDTRVRKYLAGAKKAHAVAPVRDVGDPEIGALMAAWRAARAACGRSDYRQPYVEGLRDRDALAKLQVHAAKLAAEEGQRLSQAAEALGEKGRKPDHTLARELIEHWFAEYLRDDGDRSHSFVDQRHPLEHVTWRLSSYGAPKGWRRKAAARELPPITDGPRRVIGPAPPFRMPIPAAGGGEPK